MFFKSKIFRDGEGDGAGDAGGKLPDVQSLFNETKKLQRLYEKANKENQELRQQVSGFSTMGERFNQLSSVFGGQKIETPEGERKPTLTERARKAHERMLEAYPDGGGLELTRDTAETAESSWNEVQSLKKKVAEYEAKLGEMRDPMFISEQMMFTNFEGNMVDELVGLYGDEKLALENVPLFRAKAIEKIQALKQSDYSKYVRLVRSASDHKALLRQVISDRIPRAYNTREGFHKLDDYSIEQAQADMARVPTIKDPQTRRDLQAKARKRLLQQLAEDEVRGGR